MKPLDVVLLLLGVGGLGLGVYAVTRSSRQQQSIFGNAANAAPAPAATATLREAGGNVPESWRPEMPATPDIGKVIQDVGNVVDTIVDVVGGLGKFFERF